MTQTIGDLKEYKQKPSQTLLTNYE